MDQDDELHSIQMHLTTRMKTMSLAWIFRVVVLPWEGLGSVDCAQAASEKTTERSVALVRRAIGGGCIEVAVAGLESEPGR